MRLPKITAAAMLAIALALTACSDEVDEAPSNVESPSSSTLPTATATPAVRPTPSAAQQDEDTMSTIVDFTAGDVIVEVTIAEDTPTTRSFLAMLPMTVGFSDHGGKEKVATPTGEWDFTGAEGLDPQVGDLFSYMPWGNLGFFYNVDGNTFDTSLTKIGETDDLDQIELLDGQQVTIAVAG